MKKNFLIQSLILKRSQKFNINLKENYLSDIEIEFQFKIPLKLFYFFLLLFCVCSHI